MAPTKRLFIAADLPNDAKQRVEGLLQGVDQDAPGIRWVKPQNYHFTLKFLGSCSADRTKPIEQALEIITQDTSSFEIEFSKVGGFPNLMQPKVVWMGIAKGHEELKKLAGLIERSMVSFGFEEETKEYQSHLTLARVRNPKRIQTSTDQIRYKSLENPKTVIEEISLYESITDPEGAIYKPLKTFKL